MIGRFYYDLCNFQILDNVKCPILALLSDVTRETAALTTIRRMKKTFDLLTNKQNCQHIIVQGNHNVHMNNPEIVAPYIVTFLTTQKCAL
jgi:hypothetical protein